MQRIFDHLYLLPLICCLVVMLFYEVKQAFWGYACPIRKKYDEAMLLVILRNIHYISTITVIHNTISFFMEWNVL